MPWWTGSGPLLEPVLRWLSQQWDHLWDETVGERNRHLASVLIGLALVGGLVAWVVRSLRRTLEPPPVGAQLRESSATVTAEATWAEAGRLASEGDFRAALRALYLAVLLQWDQRGKLRFDRSLTNREVLAAARGAGDLTLAGRLEPLVQRFDLLWYGGSPCSPEEYADFARLAAAAWEPS